MAEYIEREALEKNLNERLAYLLDKNGPYDYYTDGYDEAVSTVEEFLSADVAPVVRCKDCTHLRLEVDAYTQETVGYWCAELDIGSVDVDGFCSRGERKDGKEGNEDDRL